MNDYTKDREYEVENQELCDAFYNVIFEDLLENIKRVENKTWQFRGVDTVITLKDGKRVLIDEKVRRTDYGDFVVELLSNEGTGRKGWAYNYWPDYILYVLAKQRKAYLVPQLLLSLLVRYDKEYLAGCKEIKAENEGYVTASKVILFDKLFSFFASCYEI